jgi:hypothetical protein
MGEESSVSAAVRLRFMEAPGCCKLLKQKSRDAYRGFVLIKMQSIYNTSTIFSGMRKEK